MVNDPFVDSTPDGSMVVARGQVVFLQVALETASHVAVIPDADAFEQTNVRAIFNPDNVDVTAAWVTNARDPVDSSDEYDAAHPTYVGDEATPANVGLFHNGSGKIAQKVKAPSESEVTLGQSVRKWRIEWLVKKGGSLIPKTEYFHVSEAGVLVGASSFVTVSEVRTIINTQMTDAQIQSVISHVSRKARGKAKLYGFDWDSMQTLDDYLRTIIVEWCVTQVFLHDQSAYRKIEKLKEGGKRVEFSGTSSKDLERMTAAVNADFAEWLKMKAPLKRPRITTLSRSVTDNVYRSK